MVKKAILLMSAAACLGTTVNAQKCATDEMHRLNKQLHPEIAQYEAQLEKDIQQQLMQMDLRKLMKTTAVDTEVLYIPVVVHVIHDYGTENVSDASIHQLIDEMNEFFAAKNTDLVNVIDPFKPYIGKANIRFRLATKDPQGMPTHGIVRKRSYLTNGGDDQAKLDPWNPSAYYNMYIEKVIGKAASNGTVLAYAYMPATAAAIPNSDGIICAAPYIHNSGYTIQHETGHFLNLYHPWGGTNNPEVACGDDEVDDTPPTKGHMNPGTQMPQCLYDTACATGYVKNGHDYPDTTNVQNIMDYTECTPTMMITKGQVDRMRAALRSPVAQRNNLIDSANLVRTGVLAPTPDLAPIADFSLGKIGGSSSISDKIAADKVFGCANTSSFQFTDRSWNDTIASQGISWTFTNGANVTNATGNGGNVVNKTFSEPGWVTVKLDATGNNGSGTGSITRQAVYVADPNMTPAQGYFQEFDANGDVAKWPIFNYYNNDHKWEVVNNAGYYDKTSICYKNFDSRIYPASLTNTPKGDFDDFFTTGFDITSSDFATNANLTFMSAGAFRSSMSADMNDTLYIHYSIDCGESWKILKALSKTDIANNSTISTPFQPTWMGNWKSQEIALPQAVKSAGKVFFRFRYVPGGFSKNPTVGSGNNFYIDRINISSFPLGVNGVELNHSGIALAPNPTSGAANVILKGGNGNAQVVVTDITGKVVYRTEQQLNSSLTTIEIPANSISVKGIYMVQVTTNNKTQTEKLVVN